MQPSAEEALAFVRDLNKIQDKYEMFTRRHVPDNSPWGYTPLHLACQNGDIKIILELIKAGAKMNIKDGHSISPLCRAIQSGKYKIALCLALKGAVLKHEHSMPNRVQSFYHFLKL